MRSGWVKSLNGFGKGLCGGRSSLISMDDRPMTGMSALFHFGAGMEPSPTRLRSVSGKSLKRKHQYNIEML